MLCDFVSFVITARVGCGSAVSNLVFNGATASISAWEFAAADVFASSTRKIVCFTDIYDCSVTVTNAIFTGFVGRFDALSAGGVVFIGSAGFVD